MAPTTLTCVIDHSSIGAAGGVLLSSLLPSQDVVRLAAIIIYSGIMENRGGGSRFVRWMIASIYYMLCMRIYIFIPRFTDDDDE